MSSTNKTTNYELSQYVGADKPTYLGDYNSDMLKIDTQMKNNADNIASVGATATTANTTANTALADASTAQTTANNANTSASNASQVATQALSKANENEVKIIEIQESLGYSTTEKEIGTWIDSKPIYSKVLEITPEKTVRDGDWYYSYIDIDSLHIDNIIYQYGFVAGIVTDRQVSTLYKSNGAYVDISFTDYRNGVPGAGYIKYIQVGLKSTYIDAGALIKLIIHYTKTTD